MADGFTTDGITFQAIFSKATTTVDGGWNVTFAVTQDEARAILQLAQLRDTLLQVGVVHSEGLYGEPVTD